MMKNILKVLVLSLICLFVSVHPALALKFKDEGLKDGERVNLIESVKGTEIHADLTGANFWNHGVSGGTDGFHTIFDYRLEAHTPLYRLGAHKGKLVTRTEGFGTISHAGRRDFFDDALIDLPELYWQDDFQVGGNDASFVFGKFANRRFFDKDEIAPDPFDIGERPFFGTIANTNGILNSINQGRDPDNLNSIQATGSYGFMMSIKDNDGNGFFDRWGYKQAFAVAQLANFGDNMYGISEINKNWGNKKPGQFNAGFLYAKDDVFRVPELSGDGDGAYLLYSSWVQKWHDRFTSYFRYGFLNNTDSTGADFVTNHITTGLLFKATKKDILASHLAWFKSRTTTSPLIHLNFWIHKFTPSFYSTFYYIWKYGVPNPSTFDGEDNNWFIGFGLTASI